MPEINISSEKIIDAYMYMNHFYDNFPSIHEVNISPLISSKLNLSDYNQKLLAAKKSMNKSLLNINEIGSIKKTLKNIIDILCNDSTEFRNLFENTIKDFEQANNNFAKDINESSINIGGVLIQDGIKFPPNNPTGRILEVNNDYGLLYRVYVPSNVDNNTRVSVYFRGAGEDLKGNGTQGALKCIDDDLNQFVFFVNGNDNNKLIEDINSTIEQYQTENKNLNVYGFSAGGRSALVFGKDYYMSTGNKVDNIAIFDAAYNGSNLPCDEETIKFLEECKTNILYFTANSEMRDNNGETIPAPTSNYPVQQLAKTGRTYVIKTKNGHSEHVQINDEGVGSNIFKYCTGESSRLKMDNYDCILKLNLERNEWNKVELNDVAGIKNEELEKFKKVNIKPANTGEELIIKE